MCKFLSIAYYRKFFCTRNTEFTHLKLKMNSDTMFWISAGHTIAAGTYQVRKVRASQGRMPDNVRQG